VPTQLPGRQATIAYTSPFLAFVVLLGMGRAFGWPLQFVYPVQFLIVTALLLGVSRPFVSLRPSRPWASIAIGILVFVVWVAPDMLFGYRHYWLFDNFLTGSAVSSLAPDLQRNWPFLVLRTLTSMALVPILEELFWRGWLMRWLIDTDFQKVPPGTYTPQAFWLVAVLFASEHGPYWEVGLVAGIVYNWWMVRSRSLADCIVAHAVTNGLLAVYVVSGGHWQYWL
jgi:CAAX prenyl protease-like protein